MAPPEGARQPANAVPHLQSEKLPIDVRSDAEHSKCAHLQPDQPPHRSCQATLQPSTAFHVVKRNFLFQKH